jgi:flagellar FliL protein
MAKKEKKEKAKKGEKPEAEAEKPAAAAGAEGAEGEAPAKKKMAGKTLILFIVAPAVLVLGGGGAAAAMLLGGKKADAETAAGEHGEKADEHGEKKKPEKKPEKEEHGATPAAGEHGAEGAAASTGAPMDVGSLTVGAEGDPSYYSMPKLIVNLAGSNGSSQLLELQLTLEASDAAAFDEVPATMPRLKDQFQSFLRELRVEDLNGSAGSYRLRVELLRRFNAVMAPAKADAVLIDSFLVMEQ